MNVRAILFEHRRGIKGNSHYSRSNTDSEEMHSVATERERMRLNNMKFEFSMLDEALNSITWRIVKIGNSRLNKIGKK